MRAVWLLTLLLVAGCVETRYVLQAGLGQLELVGNARDVDDVMGDADTDERTRYMLQLAKAAMRYSRARGLSTKGNYEKYVELGRGAVVWFMAAARPLELEPMTWNFPIVGSFPYLGWFDEAEARKMARRLRADGYDVFVREVHAYSTGGWFRDPLLSTMLVGEDTAHLDMVNTLFHELTHANFFVTDQATFNESVASFVGDALAGEFLIAEFGATSVDVQVYQMVLAEDKVRIDELTRAYRTLDALYKSAASDAEKLRRKKELVQRLRSELDLDGEPNNASLLGFKTYNSGLPELAALRAACATWPRFFAALATVDNDSFATEQQEEIGPVITRLKARCRTVASAP